MAANVACDDVCAVKKELDMFFLITLGLIVLFMQCGFAFLEAGSVRSKNTTNILIKNLLDSFVAGISYWIAGYAFAFGKGCSFIGYENWALSDVNDDQLAFFFFQYVFAATAATIVSGALAERCEFAAYFIYSSFITAFVYPVVTHWVWSEEGWLVVGDDYTINNETVAIGYKDFAGSGVVHCVGGVAAFVGAALMGARIGRFDIDGTPVPIRGHSTPFAALGGFILIFGFMAFNGGSQLTISSSGDGSTVSLAIVNTVISGSVAAFTSLAINKCTKKEGGRHWSLLSTINGALAGMVAMCAGCNVIRPYGAAVVGLFAGVFYNLVSKAVLKMKVDDPLDAVAVHFGGGFWGVLSVALLSYNDGILYAWDKQSALMLGWQLAGLVSITAWAAILSLIMFGILKCLKVLRVSKEIEEKGLDIPKHGEPAYPLDAYGHGHWEIINSVNMNGNITPSVLGNVLYPTHKLDSNDNDHGNGNDIENGKGIGNLNDIGYDNVGYLQSCDRGPHENPEIVAMKRNDAICIPGNVTPDEMHRGLPGTGAGTRL